MASFLEILPSDILQQIAFLTASSSPSRPPNDLLHLQLTKSTIYRCLSTQTCPHLYAKIFRAAFDVSAPQRKFGHALTDSALTSELLYRHRVLHRIRRKDFSTPGLLQDLWIILWMILESDGLNETHLSLAGFLDYILLLAQAYFPSDDTASSDDHRLATEHLVVWLLCLTLSRRDIINTSTQMREGLLKWLRPCIASTKKKQGSFHSFYPCLSIDSSIGLFSITRGDSHQYNGDSTANHPGIVYYSRCRDLICPVPTYAAINLTFALKEADAMEIPTHFPENRAVAIATHRSGPTMEDFLVLTSYRTPLFADSMANYGPASATPSRNLARSAKHDLEFCNALQPSEGVPETPSYQYIPGLLTGLWQGTYMIAGMTAPDTSLSCSPCSPDFACRKPMQCALTEYLCFSPNLPIPLDAIDEVDLSPRNLFEIETGLEIFSRKYVYEKHTPLKSKARRDPVRCLDIIITGETLDDHDQAWHGFKFAGRVYRDGRVVLKREPKNAGEDYLGSWIFEGRVRFGEAFVGQWRSSVFSGESNFHGIFSMEKRSSTWQK